MHNCHPAGAIMHKKTSEHFWKCPDVFLFECGVWDYLRTQSVTSLKGWPMCLVLFMSWSSR